VAFQSDLAQHTYEASRIVEEFAAGWYGKTVWQKQQLDQEAINRFTAYAFKKLRGRTWSAAGNQLSIASDASRLPEPLMAKSGCVSTSMANRRLLPSGSRG
jgi:hypothetical protein